MDIHVNAPLPRVPHSSCSTPATSPCSAQPVPCGHAAHHSCASGQHSLRAGLPRARACTQPNASGAPAGPVGAPVKHSTGDIGLRQYLRGSMNNATQFGACVGHTGIPSLHCTCFVFQGTVVCPCMHGRCCERCVQKYCEAGERLNIYLCHPQYVFLSQVSSPRQLFSSAVMFPFWTIYSSTHNTRIETLQSANICPTFERCLFIATGEQDCEMSRGKFA